ncbi:hypothetical protein JCGZ_03554 [Jatropha curcas]|uniref:Uncharacterized protein n=1 Tax=Jatropha curcas TaxID=180498 RepID=A0A067KXY4_JATCU|nr:hypothetical protein JCGZ_03554 [Jatropha curcas]
MKEILTVVKIDTNSDLYSASLHFRLLRQHAFSVSSACVLDKFRDKNGKFLDSLAGDGAGLLSLYDASHLGMHGEDVLEEAKNFTSFHLKSLLGKLENNNILRQQVEQALDVPLHWRMRRIENRNFINIYQRDDSHNKALLELAILDYNLVQSVYQRELKELTRCWTSLDFKKKLPFSRDRLVENYLWALGSVYEPQYSKCRIVATQFTCILSAIDDMYDIYGSLDELELFTQAVNSWGRMNMDELPEYMKICHSALVDFVYEFAYYILNEEGFNALPYIKEEWARLCSSYLLEARWFNSGYTPTLNEYIRNAWISIGGHEAIMHAAMFLGHYLSKDSLRSLKNGYELITYRSSLITRLNDDLGTSSAESERGDVAKSIQCYMIDNNASEDEVKNHIRGLINDAWKKLNEESVKTSLPRFKHGQNCSKYLSTWGWRWNINWGH